MDLDSLRPDVPQVLRFWTDQEPTLIEAVPGGTLNWNFRVVTRAGAFLLRCHRDNLETERIVGEHELIAWVAERGIPAPTPIHAGSGETLVDYRTHRWSLAPWLPGEPRPRGALTRAQVRSLGRMHGLVQATLARHPESDGASMTMRWDKAESLGALSKLIDVARRKGEEGWIVAALERQRALLDAMDILTPADVDSLPCQLLHGDFHDQQVLFDGDEVSAVVDWEIWHADPRAWELVRSLSFSLLLAPGRHLSAYLTGYREHVVLDEDEIVLALRLWFQSRVVGLWAWWACLVEGNDRVRQFFPNMVAELDRVADPDWTAAITRSVIAAARG